MTAPMVDYKINWLKMMSVPESRAVVGRHDGINGRDRSPMPPFVRGDDRRRGIAFMVLAMFLFAFVDAQAKYLSERLPVLQIAWALHFGMFVAVAVVIWPRTGLAILRTRRPKLQLLRGVLVVLSSVLFLTAISFVPLADAVAVSFVAPLIITVLSALILREPVGLRRWLAVAVGFAGAVIVTRPGLGVIHPAAFLVVCSASAFALYQVLARMISDTEDVRTTLSYTVIVGAVILTVLLPFNWVWPASPLDALIDSGQPRPVGRRRRVRGAQGLCRRTRRRRRAAAIHDAGVEHPLRLPAVRRPARRPDAGRRRRPDRHRPLCLPPRRQTRACPAGVTPSISTSPRGSPYGIHTSLRTGSWSFENARHCVGSILELHAFAVECEERQGVGSWTSGVSRRGFRRRAG